MKILSTPIEEMFVAWPRVFATANPLGDPFTSSIEDVMVFFPTNDSNHYKLSKVQYQALCDAIRSIGESLFFGGVFELASKEFPDVTWSDKQIKDGHGGHFVFDATEPYEEYVKVDYHVWTALYSSTGAWGVMTSNWDAGIVGGSRDFIAAIKKSYPRWKKDLAAFKHFWGNMPTKHYKYLRAGLDELLPCIEGGLTIPAAPHPDDE